MLNITFYQQQLHESFFLQNCMVLTNRYHMSQSNKNKQTKISSFVYELMTAHYISPRLSNVQKMKMAWGTGMQSGHPTKRGRKSAREGVGALPNLKTTTVLCTLSYDIEPSAHWHFPYSLQLKPSGKRTRIINKMNI